jgi:hypothetical protein
MAVYDEYLRAQGPGVPQPAGEALEADKKNEEKSDS